MIENLKASTEGLKEHIKKLDAEKVNTKKQHNEELQRVIRTLDKKNKEHVQVTDEVALPILISLSPFLGYNLTYFLKPGYYYCGPACFISTPASLAWKKSKILILT